MLKKMICTLAALAMLIWICPPAQAEYMGELRRDIDWVINVDNSAAGGKTAVNVHYLISRRDENQISRAEIEIGLAAAGARTQLIFSKPGRGVRRIIIEVDPPQTATIDVEIVQAQSFPHRFEGRGCLVFEVVD
jgi:hypothetical protein